MAVYRETPKCSHCGKAVARAVYNPRPSEYFVGDTFSHWDHWLCQCPEAVAEREKFQEEMKPLVKELNDSIEKEKKQAEDRVKRFAKKVKEKAKYRKKMEDSIKSKLTEEEIKYLKLD